MSNLKITPASVSEVGRAGAEMGLGNSFISVPQLGMNLYYLVILRSCLFHADKALRGHKSDWYHLHTPGIDTGHCITKAFSSSFSRIFEVCIKLYKQTHHYLS